jgi:hypothetical protein
MNKLMTRVGVGTATLGLATMTIAFASAAGAAPVTAAAPTTTTTLGPPAQGTGVHKVFLYVDTVTGAGSNPAPAAGCAQTNLFQPGQVVVFRMDGVNAAAGGIDLTSATVLNAYVKVPGLTRIPMVYGTHGKASYWTAAWTISATYPVGIVDFWVHVTTKAIPKTATSPAVPQEAGNFTQVGLAPPSQLTVVKA